MQASTALGSHLPRYEGLQLLRVLAALLVVTLHCTFYVNVRLSATMPAFYQGMAGVDIFFVLSGFVMVYSSQKLIGHPLGWQVFLERRLARIVPLYWVVTTIKLAAVLGAANMVQHSLVTHRQILLSYLFIPSIPDTNRVSTLVGVGWTLCFEMLFYLIFTLALFFRLNIFKFTGTVLALLALGSVFRNPHWPIASFYLDPLVLEFFFGMLVAQACLGSKHLPPWPAVLVVVLAFTLIIAGPSLHRLPEVVIYGVPAALLVWAVASLEPYLARLPGFAVLLAEASYATYLFHTMIVSVVPSVFARRHLVLPHLAVVVSVCSALTAGLLLYLAVDRPIAELLRNRIRTRHQKVLRKPLSLPPQEELPLTIH